MTATSLARKLCTMLLSVLLATVQPPVAGAQISGILTGTVTDALGAAIPGAEVKATNQATGQTLSTRTDATGQYSIKVPPGTYEITVSVASFAVSRTTVTAEVGRAEKYDFTLAIGTTKSPHPAGDTGWTPPPQERLTGRSFLAHDKKEVAGYGLYSYFLLGAHPDDEARPRVIAAIKSLLTEIEPIEDLLDLGVRRELLNVTYMPVKRSPPAGQETTAEWVLNNYDFTRSAFLLSRVPGGGQHLDGPYFVSSLRPLTLNPDPGQNFLFQDLSYVPPRLAVSWVKAFETQASKPQFWKPNTMSQLLLDLRTLIAESAPEVSDIRSAVLVWITELRK
jgi:hypothetical protein